MKKNLGNFKTRKNGNSISLTVPKTIGIQENEEFSLSYIDGNLIYKPIKKNNNPWENGEYSKYDFRKLRNELDFEIINSNSVGKENTND